MATAAEHIAYARQYLTIADRLQQSNPALAGEACWGAVIQALQAAGHARNASIHPQSPTAVRTAINRLPVAQNNKTHWLNAAHNTAALLHGGFYRPELIAAQKHQIAMTNARRLALALIRAAQN